MKIRELNDAELLRLISLAVEQGVSAMLVLARLSVDYYSYIRMTVLLTQSQSLCNSIIEKQYEGNKESFEEHFVRHYTENFVNNLEKTQKKSDFFDYLINPNNSSRKAPYMRRVIKNTLMNLADYPQSPYSNLGLMVLLLQGEVGDEVILGKLKDNPAAKNAVFFEDFVLYLPFLKALAESSSAKSSEYSMVLLVKIIIEVLYNLLRQLQRNDASLGKGIKRTKKALRAAFSRQHAHRIVPLIPRGEGGELIIKVLKQLQRYPVDEMSLFSLFEASLISSQHREQYFPLLESLSACLDELSQSYKFPIKGLTYAVKSFKRTP